VTSIARGIGISDYNIRSIVVFSLIVALVAAMFFIPEIVGVDTHSTDSGVSEELLARRKARAGQQVEVAQKISPETEVKRRDLGDAEEVPYRSPLKKLMAMLQSKPEGAGKLADISSSKIGDATPIDWKTLRSKETQGFLIRAERETRKLAKVIDDQYEQSKFALYNYANGIKNVLKGSSKTMSADEAVQFLARLDGEVTTALLGEAVEPSIFNEWADITLGPLFENTRSHQMKVAKRFPFDPQFRILWARITQPPDRFGKFIEGGKAHLSFKVTVVGRDVKKVRTFHNGIRISDRSPRFAKGTSARFFTHQNADARGIYTFRIYDKRNRFIDRSYNFYAAARKFPWMSRRRGRFNIPLSEGDPRMDGLFLIQSSEQARQTTYFSANSEASPGTTF